MAEPCLPAADAAHAGAAMPHRYHFHRVVGRIRHRLHPTSPHAAAHTPSSVACGRPEMLGGELPAMPAGRAVPKTVAASAKLAKAVKVGSLLAAVGLAGAGATLSGLAPPTPPPGHATAQSGDPGAPPALGPPVAPADPGQGRIPVPEPSSGAVLIAAAAGVIALRLLTGRGRR